MLTSWQQVVAHLKKTGSSLAPSARLVQDSRQVRKGDVFVAIRGEIQDGSRYIQSALDKNASLILVSSRCGPEHYRTLPLGDTPLLVIDDLENRLPAFAKAFYLEQEPQLPLIGITGTNGKTSISHMLAQLFEASTGKDLAVIGTMGTGSIHDLTDSANTTPGVTDVYRLLKSFRQDTQHEFACVAMEVSSHALEQNRVKGLAFDVAIFTNLTLDHLDYHGSMVAYFEAKAKLFTAYAPKYAVINLDDEYGRQLAARIDSQPTKILAYGQSQAVLSVDQYVFVESFSCQPSGLEVNLRWQFAGQTGTSQLKLPLFGEFNCLNLAAVYATALALGWPITAAQFSSLSSVPGRLELFTQPNLPIAVVDYAHTPDALEQSLKAVRAHLKGQLYLVFGCGGDRDASKRPIMGMIAERLADMVIVTNDNPRTEAPEAIAAQIQAGFISPERHLCILDRQAAIKAALAKASAQDVVLIAGKGHETYQIIGQTIIDYDERAFTQATLEKMQADQSPPSGQ